MKITVITVLVLSLALWLYLNYQEPEVPTSKSTLPSANNSQIEHGTIQKPGHKHQNLTSHSIADLEACYHLEDEIHELINNEFCL